MPNIEPYIHRCIIESGDLAGNEHTHAVTSYDLEYGMLCDNCYEPVATPEKITAHIYRELLSEF